ncbi:MAG: ribonuclease R [Bacteroidetes bacterium]|nr:ribonuclease R [Bacteroidota bacterium]
MDDLNGELKTEILFILAELQDKGDVIETERGKFQLKPKHAYLEGIIDITNGGAAYILSENDEDDVYIAPKNVKNALHGDKVKIYLYARHRNQRIEGEVVEILERAKTEFAGMVQLSGKYAFVVPDSSKMLVDIFIPQNMINNAQHGQKVIAEIVDWPKGTKNPIGKITKILGWPGENDVEMNSILSEYGFPLEFPKRVEEEAEKIPLAIPEDEIKRRRDFRKITTFTIDPVDAKDFDDALSIQKLPNGNYEIGVHIADVSHYVKPTSQLDKEAYYRATSIYLVDRVIPMLPEKLSNGVCSLRPHEEKLCFAAVFEMNDNAEVVKKWFGKTVIYSDHRFAYEDAQEVIETGEGPLKEEILTMDRLAKILRKERFKDGAIAFEKVEVRFRLDEKGKPLGIYLKESKDANKLIEEFMLLANRSVAEFVGKKHDIISEGKNKSGNQEETIRVEKKPFVYRVHDSPVSDRLENFVGFARKFGYTLKIGNDREIASSLNGLMKDVHGKKEQNVLESLAIRTMSKAVYTTENIGHYGLAFDYYTHFTSPIRRYPDVLVHRLLEHYLAGGKGADASLLEEQCKHSTQMEIKASEAERASTKYKQVEYLQDKVGEEFDGVISGVTEWGLYVEIIENKCEGMIRLRDLDDDFYEFDETNYCVIGSRTKHKYTMGDVVRIQVMRCDLLRKQIDFKMISRISEQGDVTMIKKPVKVLRGGNSYHRKKKR